MPTPSSKTKRMAVIFLAALLLAVGYWSQRHSPPPVLPKPALQPKPAVLADTSTGDRVERTNALTVVPEQSVTNPSPKQSGVAGARQLTDRPNESTKPVDSSPAKAPQQPAAVACDQLIFPNGDLVEVTVKEIGIREIRYKKCRWPQGPDYVVLKADVLSIRFANGDIERFGGRN